MSADAGPATTITQAISRCYRRMVVAKDGNNTQQNYRYMKHADILAKVREAMADEGLALFPINLVVLSNEPRMQPGREGLIPDKGHRAVVQVTYELRLHGTDEVRIINWVGQADDFQDRAISKAVVFCNKTLLKDLFMISESEDDDPDGPKRDRDESRAASAPSKQAATKPAVQQAPATPATNNLPTAFGYQPSGWPEGESFTKPPKDTQIAKLHSLLDQRGFKDWAADEREKALSELAKAFGLAEAKAATNGGLMVLIAFFQQAEDDAVSALYKKAGGV